jgi:hypothetical protein
MSIMHHVLQALGRLTDIAHQTNDVDFIYVHLLKSRTFEEDLFQCQFNL